jgi:hypothetical protein
VIRSPDRPARSESLYRLSYRGPTHIVHMLDDVLFKINSYNVSFVKRGHGHPVVMAQKRNKYWRDSSYLPAPC